MWKLKLREVNEVPEFERKMTPGENVMEVSFLQGLEILFCPTTNPSIHKPHTHTHTHTHTYTCKHFLCAPHWRKMEEIGRVQRGPERPDMLLFV